MTDHTLHGNHDPCPACEERRARLDLTRIDRDPVPCNLCGGDSFIPLPDAEIVRRAAEAARRDYWPAREAAWARQNRRRRRIGQITPGQRA